MCTVKNLDCVSNIKVDNTECLHQCSGTIVVSYDKLDIDDSLDERFRELVKYMGRKDGLYYDMAYRFQGCHN